MKKFMENKNTKYKKYNDKIYIGNNIEYYKHLLNELNNRHGDIDEIKQLENIIKKIDIQRQEVKKKDNESSNIEYYKYLLNELKSRHGDADEIQRLEKKIEKSKKEEVKTKRKIKGYSSEKKAFRGKIYGIILGIAIGIAAYNCGKYMAYKLPNPHNYTTVEENKKNLEHDDSGYREFLRKNGLSEEEIEKKIAEEEELGRWGRKKSEETKSKNRNKSDFERRISNMKNYTEIKSSLKQKDEQKIKNKETFDMEK